MGAFDMMNLMKNAKKMQEMMEQQQAELAKVEVIGESGAGAVTLKMNAQFQALSLEIDPAFAEESPEILHDLILAAINHATRQIQTLTREKMMDAGKLLGGNLGGLGDLLK